MKVLFIGNSITRHLPKEDIKWFEDCGMAATKLENDYVHKCVCMLEKHFKVEYMLKNIADWEREYLSYDYLNLLPEQNFCADILVMRISENLCQEYCKLNDFASHYQKLIDFLVKNNPTCKVITTSNFWGFDKVLFADEIISIISNEKGYSFVGLGDLSNGKKYKAYPKKNFQPTYADNQGVCEHPNDVGMNEIAKRIYLTIKEITL